MKFATYIDGLAAALLGALGLLGTFLASVGLYGVIAQSVSRRTREIGIRVALGAEPRSIVAMVLREGLTLAVVGVAVGGAGAIAGAVAVSKMLFGVRPADPFSYVCAAVIVLAVAAAACHAPARWATRVDPAVALGAQ